MTTTKVKEGDLINVVKEEAKKGGDLKTIMVNIPAAGEGLGRGRNRKIFKIKHTDFHESLTKLGVNVGHYTLEAIKVEAINYPPDRPDVIVVNGEFEIPDPDYSGVAIKKNIVDAYFDDEEVATSIAVQLNEAELEKLVELEDLVVKARGNMEDVVKNKRV